MLGLGFTLFGLRLSAGTGTAPALPGLIASPGISGTASPGQTLSGDIGTWSAATGYDWVWLRDGAAIAGAAGTGSAVAGYTVQAGDAGHALRLQVTASNSAGTRSAYSDALTVPAAAGGAFSAGFAAGFGS